MQNSKRFDTRALYGNDVVDVTIEPTYQWKKVIDAGGYNYVSDPKGEKKWFLYYTITINRIHKG